MIEAEVKVVGSGMENNVPIVILAPKEEKGILPMRIGSMEALAIMLARKEKEVPRPLTHDLLSNTLDKWEIKLDKVEIVKIENNIFYAELVTKKEDRTERIDARPSDSIALALRKKAPIYISRQVAEESFVYMDASEFVDEYKLEDFNVK